MPENIFDEIMEYIEMNVMHPFMEGNGGSTSIWLEQIKQFGMCEDWKKNPKEDYLYVMHLSLMDIKRWQILNWCRYA